MCALAFQKLCLNLNLMLSVNCWTNIYSCSALVFRSLSDNVHVMRLLSSLYKNYILSTLFSEYWLYVQMLPGAKFEATKRQKKAGSSRAVLTCWPQSWISLGQSTWNLSLPGVFGYSSSIRKNSDIVHCPSTHPGSCSFYLSCIRSMRSVAGETLSVFGWFCFNVLYILVAWFLQSFMQGMCNK